MAEQAAPQAAQAAPQTADGVVTDFSKVNFADFEQHAIMEAGTKNLNVYGVHVKVDPSCILKAARAFLVFKSVEELGEIIKSIPSAQDIEDEKFDLDFDIFVITGESLDKVLATVRNVSEIKDAEGSIIKLDEKKEEKPEETEKTESAKPATVPQAGKPANPQPAKGKPVVNRSVRVDIDKLDVLMNLVSELIIAKNGLVSAAATSNTEENQSVNEQIEYLERVTTNLHESVMNVRMVPIETVVNRFPRMIRDLSKNLTRKWNFT